LEQFEWAKCALGHKTADTIHERAFKCYLDEEKNGIVEYWISVAEAAEDKLKEIRWNEPIGLEIVPSEYWAKLFRFHHSSFGLVHFNFLDDEGKAVFQNVTGKEILFPVKLLSNNAFFQISTNEIVLKSIDSQPAYLSEAEPQEIEVLRSHLYLSGDIRLTHCWGCSAVKLSNLTHRKCEKCGWLICDNGHCKEQCGRNP